MGIEEGIFWDENWVLYASQFDNKFHILKKKKMKKKMAASFSKDKQEVDMQRRS